MEYIKGITYGAFAGAGELSKKEAFDSLNKLIERTGANYIVLIPNGLQDTPQSQTIDYSSPATCRDDELIIMIEHIHARGLKVALKPTVNCKNGTWRAHICFFDKDVPCEPKWSVWFDAYTDFQLHYAKIAEDTGCEMFIAGCEMVQSEHREAEWRKLISDIRDVYHGPVTYNTDKYQEDNVTWWDCVDYICSSGYYPVNDWENQLDRIEPVVKKFGKPFFFAEAGCRSAKGAQDIPNDWTLRAPVSIECQTSWYKVMLDAISSRDWVQGLFLWDWRIKLYPEKNAHKDDGFDIYGKPVEKLVHDFYMQR